MERKYGYIISRPRKKNVRMWSTKIYYVGDCVLLDGRMWKVVEVMTP